MEKNQNDRYDALVSYINDLHEKNRKRVRASGIALVLLPVVLGLIRWLTDSDKTVFLILWVLCMFLLAAYLVSIEYYDHILCKRLESWTGQEADPSGLLDAGTLVPGRVRERVRSRLAADPSAFAKDGEAAGAGKEGGDA